MKSNSFGQQVGDVVPDWTARSMPGEVKLRGAHVVAEPLAAVHARDLFDELCGRADKSLWTYRPMPMPRSVTELDANVVRVLVGHAESSSYAFVPVGGTAAGLATFYPCVPASGVLEISGVVWGRSMQRTTAATEAIHLMLGYAFDGLGYRRVEWKCDSLNEASRRAAARLGFTYEGRFRQHMVTKGRNRDTDWFSMLDAEWPGIRARNERWLAPQNFDEQGNQRQRLADYDASSNA